MAFDTYNGIHFDNNEELADIIRKDVETEYKQEIAQDKVCKKDIEKEVKRRIDGFYGNFA